MRYYIVDKNGNVCGDYDFMKDAQTSLENDFTSEQITQDELEIIEGNF